MSDEDDVFRAAMGDVEPLKPGRQVPEAPRPGTPTPDQLARRRHAANDPNEEGGERALTLAEVPSVAPDAVLAWRQDGVQLGVFDKLRTGGYAVEGQLDLHHRTVAEARLAVWRFLNDALDNDWRCVLVTHGRGERSAIPARLKSFVAHWLEAVPLVIALHTALPRHGGAGATYALLRKSHRARARTAEEHGGKGAGPEAVGD